MRLLSLPLDTLGGCGLLSVTSPLGELGRQFAHNLLPTSSPCRHDGPKPEPTSFRDIDAAASCREELCNRGYVATGSQALAVRLPGVLAIPQEGWQRDASSFLEQLFLDSSLLPRVSQDDRALFRFQGGPLAALQSSSPLPFLPVCREAGARVSTNVFLRAVR